MTNSKKSDSLLAGFGYMPPGSLTGEKLEEYLNDVAVVRKEMREQGLLVDEEYREGMDLKALTEEFDEISRRVERLRKGRHEERKD